MENKKQVLIGGIAALILFAIVGMFALIAAEERKDSERQRASYLECVGKVGDIEWCYSKFVH